MEENMLRCVTGRCGPTQDHLRGDCDVSIECVQSSEFVVGKQVNFNEAVTIINCAHAEGAREGRSERREEKIVIRDKVLAPTAPTQDVTERRGKLAGVKEKFYKWRKLQHRKFALLVTSIFICVGLLVTTVVHLVILFPAGSTAGNGTEIRSDNWPFYSKEDWRGLKAKSIVKMKLPIPYVVVSHTVTPYCYNLKTCASLIQNMQTYHFVLKFADIAYNFLVDSSGNIYEGRGWDRRNVKGGFVNGRNIDIALIGDYSDNIEPTKDLMKGLRRLLDLGLASQKISRDYSLIASNSTYATLSPGKNVYNIIKDWPHFDPHPKAHIKEFEE